MVQRRRDAGFVTETGDPIRIVGEMRRQNLYRHPPIETEVPGKPDFAHPSGAERSDDLISVQAVAGTEGHAENSTPAKRELR